MRKPDKSDKAIRYFRARARYAAKRHSDQWKRRKKSKRFYNKVAKQRKKRQQQKLPVVVPAPSIFSLVDNTNEVLEYFTKAEKLLRDKENVILDISDVQVLTPATILLMVASINDKDFLHESVVYGDAPKQSDLARLFKESGFYDHVKAKGKFVSNKNNLLHKEVNHKVKPEIAKDASLTGIKHVFNRETPFEPLYEILVECMSNTNNHADPDEQGKCLWWLFAYNEPDQKITSYSFLDLGVGIFESVVVKNYVRNLAKGTMLFPNVNLVDDLLSGKLQSRTEEDKEIRGKGIPQIFQHSQSNHFKSFYIIANNVKINLKNGEREQLKFNLNGTFLYWELQN